MIFVCSGNVLFGMRVICKVGDQPSIATTLRNLHGRNLLILRVEDDISKRFVDID